MGVLEAPDPDAAVLRKLMPRLQKLVKFDGFKAKAALLTLIGSVIGVGSGSQQILRNLVPCLVEFVSSSEDWAARKAAAEALLKLAVVKRNALFEFKDSCLKFIFNDLTHPFIFSGLRMIIGVYF